MNCYECLSGPCMEDGDGNYGTKTTCNYSDAACRKTTRSKYEKLELLFVLEKNVNEYNKYSSVFILGEQSLTDWPSSISSSSRTCVNGSVFYKDGCVGGISGPLELEDCICRNEDLCNLSNTITVDNVKIMIFTAIMVNLFSYS